MPGKKQLGAKTVARAGIRRADARRGALRRGAILGGVLLSFALVIQGVFGANGLLTLRRKRSEYDSLSRKIQQLKQENGELQQQIQGLRSDPETIGRYAREELHMARPGELIYLLPQNGSQTTEREALSSRLPKP